MNDYVFKLYVTGRTSRSEQAIATLQRIGDEHLRGRFKLTVIDIDEQPRLAKDNRILATPTLIKEQPAPSRRVIGDLSSMENVLLSLDLAPSGNGPEPKKAQ